MFLRDFSVTIDGIWTDDRFIELLDTVRDYTLQFTITYTHASAHSHVIISRCSVASSNSGLSLSSGFPNYHRPQLPASHSNSSQRPNLSSSVTNWLTN
jgi:hypothetical protein